MIVIEKSESDLVKKIFSDYCLQVSRQWFHSTEEAYQSIKDYFLRFGYDIFYHNELYDEGMEDDLIGHDYFYVRKHGSMSISFVYMLAFAQDEGKVSVSIRPYMANQQGYVPVSV